MRKNLLTTGEFASLCGTQKGTLLFYEKEGLLKPKHVSENAVSSSKCNTQSLGIGVF